MIAQEAAIIEKLVQEEAEASAKAVSAASASSPDSSNASAGSSPASGSSPISPYLAQEIHRVAYMTAAARYRRASVGSQPLAFLRLSTSASVSPAPLSVDGDGTSGFSTPIRSRTASLYASRSVSPAIIASRAGHAGEDVRSEGGAAFASPQTGPFVISPRASRVEGNLLGSIFRPQTAPSGIPPSTPLSPSGLLSSSTSDRRPVLGRASTLPLSVSTFPSDNLPHSSSFPDGDSKEAYGNASSSALASSYSVPSSESLSSSDSEPSSVRVEHEVKEVTLPPPYSAQGDSVERTSASLDRCSGVCVCFSCFSILLCR